MSRFYLQKDAKTVRRKLLYFKDVDRETIQKLIDAMEAVIRRALLLFLFLSNMG